MDLRFSQYSIQIPSWFLVALATTAPGQQPANGIASQIARAKLAIGCSLKFVLRNQFSAALATTAPGQQPANGIAAQIARAKLAISFLSKFEL